MPNALSPPQWPVSRSNPQSRKSRRPIQPQANNQELPQRLQQALQDVLWAHLSLYRRILSQVQLPLLRVSPLANPDRDQGSLGPKPRASATIPDGTATALHHHAQRSLLSNRSLPHSRYVASVLPCAFPTTLSRGGVGTAADAGILPGKLLDDSLDHLVPLGQSRLSGLAPRFRPRPGSTRRYSTPRSRCCVSRSAPLPRSSVGRPLSRRSS